MTLPSQLSDEEIRVVREALTGRPSWLELARALEAEATTHDSEALKMLSLAFIYDLISPSQDARRTTAGSPYASMIESDLGVFPPRPREVVDEVRSIWCAARDAVDDPIVRARICDLLYVADGKTAHEDGRQGAQELAKLAEESAWGAMDRAVCSARSIEVFVELNDRESLTVAIGIAGPFVVEMLDQEHPGPPLTVLRSLVGLKTELRPDDLDELLDRVIKRFDGHHAAEGALELAAQATSDSDRQKELRRRQLQLRIDEAAAAEGLTRVTFLQRAIELAHRYGFAKEMRELLREQQDLPKEDLGFETMETSVDLPAEEIREQIDLIVGSHAEDIFDALKRFGSFGPPGGAHSDIDREVEEQEKEHPLLGIFGQQMFNPETSAPTFIANDAAGKRLMGRGRQREIHINFYGGVLYAPMLDEAVKQYGRPSREELTQHFATELIGIVRGERFARALEFFWDQEYDESAHLIVPRLESVLRDMARRSGVPIVKPAQEGRFGGVISLNAILPKLRELYEPAPWFDYLEALLCDPLATNLRNNIAHGVVDRVGGVYAALLIQASCYLTLMAQNPDPSS